MHSLDNLKESVGRGDAVVGALEEWRALHGSFPGALEQVVPEFLPKIEPPTAGRPLRWRYKKVGEGAGFTLSFGFTQPFRSEDKMYPYCGYSQRAWHCEEARKSGEPITSALEAWRAERGEYPDLLSELGAERLAPEVWPEGETQWTYRLNWGLHAGYMLRFESCKDRDAARCTAGRSKDQKCIWGECGHKEAVRCVLYHGWSVDN